MTTPIGRFYAEMIFNDLGLKEWFLNEDVASIFPPEFKSISRVLSQMVRHGYLKKEIVIAANNGNTYKWRVVSLKKTSVNSVRAAKKEAVVLIETPPCLLSENMGIKSIETRPTGRICRGTGHGSGAKMKISAWARKG